MTTLTPSQILERFPVLTAGQVAVVLGHFRRDGTPNRRAVYSLIDSGALAVIDATQTRIRQRVSNTELGRYIQFGPRRRVVAPSPDVPQAKEAS